ncbi:MAG: hypothetical protein WCF26_15175 [Candidatus Sulfotelmatobacter sp.]
MRFQVFLLLVLLSLIGISAAQDTNFSQGPQYVITGDAAFLQPISTPILSLEAPLPPIPSLPQIGPPVTNQPYVSNPDLQHQANLFPIYYGYPMIPVVELTGAEPSQPLPASITGVGYTVIADSQTLRELGYGVTVGEAASYWKAHKPHVNHVYSNADIERLHRS